MADCDLLIRNATIVDGTGADPFKGDIAISGGHILSTDAGGVRGREEINAAGHVVAPGFVDLHTHFDGQATWSNRFAPSTNHGATTIVAGNCGVGFAPCRDEDQDRLVRLMEGVEDIPDVVLTEGLPWTWETFPQYMDFLSRRRFDADMAAYLPHAPLRVYAMGERGANREPARAADIEVMAKLTKEAMAAGAIGFSSSRTLAHRSSIGELTPNITAAESELMGIARAMGETGQGVLQIIVDFEEPVADFGLLRRLVERSGRPLSLTLLQMPTVKDNWRAVLDMIEQANNDGLPIKGQVIGRPVGGMLGLTVSRNPFSSCPSYKKIADLPFAERYAALSDPDMRRKLIAEYADFAAKANPMLFSGLDKIYPFADPINYDPDPSDSIEAEARRRGVDPVEYAYDLMMSDGGKFMMYHPVLNFCDNSLDAAETMIKHKDTLMGLGDGGAHVGIICDSSASTHLLTHWYKEKQAFTLPEVIRSLSAKNAQAMGLNDRGILAPGYRADINIIDFDALTLRAPRVVNDLPLGGSRLHQDAEGYVATICAGEVTYRDGEPTDNLPGRLVRGGKAAPSPESAAQVAA